MGLVWSVGIFEEAENYQIGTPPNSLIKVFDSKEIRLRRSHIHTYADPFLFVNGTDLYLLAEIQEIGKQGYINAWRTSDLKEWTDLGVILRERHHVSYPFIFNDCTSGEIYLLPESGTTKNICIYKFGEFPLRLDSKTELIKGNYADSNILFQDDTYYLSTINQDTHRHELFFSDNLLGGWCKHPGQLKMDKSFMRNGGGFYCLNGELFRFAQNTSGRYGGGLAIFHVTELNKTNYSETLINGDFRPGRNYNWQEEGRHHLSIARFHNKTVMAMDGLQKDFVINKISNLFYRFT